MSGEMLWSGIAASYDHLLQGLADSLGFLGMRVLWGTCEISTGYEFQAAYAAASQERPMVINVVCDSELNVHLCSFLKNRRLSHLPPSCWQDRTFVYRACKTHGDALYHALHPVASPFREDRPFLLAAIAAHAEALKHVATPLLFDPAFCIEAVKANARAYAWVPSLVRQGSHARELAELVICNRKMARRIPPFLDRTTVAQAVASNINWLRFSSCRGDRAAISDCLELLTTRSDASWRAGTEVWHTRAPASLLQWTTQGVRSCEAVVTKAVKRCWRELKFASADLRDTRAVVLAAVECHWRALQYASAALRGDRDLVLAAVEQNGLALCFATEALRSDRELATAAVRKQWRALQYVSRDLLKDTELLLLAAAANPRALLLVPVTLLPGDYSENVALLGGTLRDLRTLLRLVTERHEGGVLLSLTTVDAA
jgi:hypothetical protein